MVFWVLSTLLGFKVMEGDKMEKGFPSGTSGKEPTCQPNCTLGSFCVKGLSDLWRNINL